MPAIYLDNNDYKQATADLWRQDQLRRVDAQYAPPPAPPETAPGPGTPTPAAPAPSPPVAAGQGALPPPQPPPPVSPSTPAPAATPPHTPDPQAIDTWKNGALADSWRKDMLDQLDKGMGPVVDALNQTLNAVPPQAQGLARSALNLPQVPGASTTSESTQGAISGTSQTSQAAVSSPASSAAPPSPPPAVAAPTAPMSNPASTQQPVPGGDLIQYARGAAQKAGVDPDIFVRQIQQESGFNPSAKSAAGAIGIAQMMPATAQGTGIDPTEPYQSLDGAARLMSSHLQKYGGDYSKALAAYNAGPGAVDQYGGVPPYAETQRYVANILGAGGDHAMAVSPGSAAVTPPAPLNRPSQFQLGLSDSDAYAACGPAAAIAFARAYGRNPTSQEAMQLAQQSGWTQAGGMNGVVNEKKLMDALGVPTKLETGQVDWGKVTGEVQNGNPVVVSTPGHYFTVDDARTDANGQTTYHVGTSGTDLKAGSDWMSAADMQRVMGMANGALYADHPQAQGPSITESVAQTAKNVGSAVQVKAQDLLGAVQGIAQNIGSSPLGPVLSAARGPELLSDQDILRASSPAEVQGAREDIGRFRGTIGNTTPASDQDVADYLRQSREAQAFALAGHGPYDKYGVEQGFTPLSAKAAPPAAAPTPPSNPFLLSTEPTPGYTPLAPEQAAQHLEDLSARYTTNDSQIATLENQLDSGALRTSTRTDAGGIVRPPWAGPRGTSGAWTDQGLMQYARSIGESPYQPDWWPSQAGEAVKAGESGFKRLGADLQTNQTQVRAQLAQLRTENEQIMAATDHMLDNADASAFYRYEQPAPSALPWEYNAPSATAAADTGGANQAGGLAYQGNAPQGAGAPLAPRIANGATPADLAAPGVTRPGYPSYPAPPQPATAPEPQPANVATQGLQNMAAARTAPAPLANPNASAAALTQRLQQLQQQITPPRAPPAPPGQLPLPTGAGPGGPPAIPPGRAAPPTPPTVPPVPPAGGGVGAAGGGAAAPAPVAQPGSFWQVLNAYHSGNVVMGPATAIKVAANTAFSPMWNFGTQSARDLLTLNLDRVMGRTIGAQQALVNIGGDFMGGFGQAMANRTTSSVPIVDAFLAGQRAVGGALHAGMQSVAGEAVRRMELGAAAGEQAAAVAGRGPAGLAQIAAFIQNPASLPADAVARANDLAARASLRAPAGATQQVVQNMLNQAANSPAGAVANFLLPVFRIGAQAAARGIEASPIGLAGTGVDVARGAAGFGPYAQGFSQYGGAVTPLADRLTNNIAGTAVTAWLASKALDGTITGVGPTDPRARSNLQAEGWRPESVLIPGTGYVSYARLPEQLRVPLELAGAFGEAVIANPNDPAGTAGRLAQSVGQMLMQGLPGLNTLADVGGILKGDPYAVGYLLGGSAAGYIPGSGALSNVATAMDPYTRKIPAKEGFGPAIAANVEQALPVLRQTLQPNTNVLGQPTPNPAAGVAGLLPARTPGEVAPGTPGYAALTFLNQHGVILSAAPPSITYAGKQLTLTPDEQATFEQIRATRLDQLTAPYQNSQRFPQLPPDQQAVILHRLDREASTYAEQRLLAQMPRDDRTARITAAPRASGAFYMAPAATTLTRMMASQAEQSAATRHAALLQQLAGPSAR